ncbi:hypothetical protein ACFPFV_12940 [Salinicoccus siamensis]|uniref:hypothetical protein n=1 Tax=Salinicoccus siamensis TaxID=381830 RepID=UPI00360E6C1B
MRHHPKLYAHPLQYRREGVAVAAALLFIQSSLMTDIVAIGLFILLVAFQYYKKKKQQRAPEAV